MSKKLFLEKFTCMRNNDDDDADSPYFLVFVGKKASPGSAFVKPLYLQSLDDTVAATGVATLLHKEVADPIDDKTFVMVALLERDGGIDIANEEFTHVQSTMRNRFAELVGNNNTDAQLRRKMRNSFHSTIVNNASGGFDGDDLIDVKSVSIPSTGQPPLLDMHDNPDSGRYLVSFRVQ